MKGLISVIVPVYNAELFLSECLDSILAQTYEKIEVLAIDDGSTDGSLQILHSYCNRDPRVKVMHNQNGKGAAGARNYGIDRSSGEFICFLDSDDRWNSNKLELQLDLMLSKGANFSYTSYYVIDEKSAIIGAFDVTRVTDFGHLTRTCDIGCSTVLVEKSFLGERRFPKTYKEDYALWLLLFRDAKIRAIAVFERCASYRVSSGSISSKKYVEIFRQWNVLRHYGKLNFFQCVGSIICYGMNGLYKHYWKYRGDIT